MTYIHAQSLDRDNSRFVLFKPWIQALCNIPRIGRDMHLMRGAKYGWTANRWIVRVA